MNALTYGSEVVWVVLQVVMIYYQGLALRITRRALRVLRRRDGAPLQVGDERFRAQWWRMSAILLNLALGILALLNDLHGLGFLFIAVLLYGEVVLLRNTRADVRLIRSLAQDIGIAPVLRSRPMTDTPDTDTDPGSAAGAGSGTDATDDGDALAGGAEQTGDDAAADGGVGDDETGTDAGDTGAASAE